MNKRVNKGVLTLEEIVFGVLIRIVCSADDVEGRASGQHFVEEDAQRPPVDGKRVVLATKDLGSDVIGCS